jgi:hypothetical protein
MTDDSVGNGKKQSLIIYNQSAMSFSALTTKNFPLLKLSLVPRKAFGGRYESPLYCLANTASKYCG